MSDCDARYLMFSRCRFEARYDVGPADIEGIKRLNTNDPEFMEKFRAQTYVKDVCVRCGKTVKRED